MKLDKNKCCVISHMWNPKNLNSESRVVVTGAEAWGKLRDIGQRVQTSGCKIFLVPHT